MGPLTTGEGIVTWGDGAEEGRATCGDAAAGEAVKYRFPFWPQAPRLNVSSTPQRAAMGVQPVSGRWGFRKTVKMAGFIGLF
jgi:hypothetical protein